MDGFLGNEKRVDSARDLEQSQYTIFLEVLWQIFGPQPFTASQVAAKVKGNAIPIESLPTKLQHAHSVNAPGFIRAIGLTLTAATHKASTLKIIDTGAEHVAAKLYRLEAVDPLKHLEHPFAVKASLSLNGGPSHPVRLPLGGGRRGRCPAGRPALRDPRPWERRRIPGRAKSNVI